MPPHPLPTDVRSGGPEQPLHLTTAQLFQLQQASAAVVATLNRAKRKDWTAGEKHLHKRCKELLAVIVKAPT